MNAWREHAACRGLEYLFLSDDREDASEAKQVCKSCPVFAACLDFAKQITPTAGVWAGRDYADRRQRKGGVPNNAIRAHGPDTEPHSCQRPECREQSRAYNRAHMQRKRSAA